MKRWKLTHMHCVKDTQDIEFPFLGEIRRVGKKCERDLHADKLHRVRASAYFSG